jgi:8-oxo-dGTP pyrophosphatase MutT (NUDIX family)
MEFSNKHNEEVNLPDGRTVWLSRSVAVVVQVWCVTPRTNPKVLLVKRGPGCPDEVGKYGLPCGYLDWNETTGEACMREVWEEAGLDISKFVASSNNMLYNNLSKDNPQPWLVISNPKDDGRENVCLHYAVFAYFENEDDIPSFETPSGGEKDETTDVVWGDAIRCMDKSLAFGHETRIKEFLDHFSKITDIVSDLKGK